MAGSVSHDSPNAQTGPVGPSGTTILDFPSLTHAHPSPTQHTSPGIEPGLRVICVSRTHGHVDDDRLHGQHGSEQPP